MAFTPIETQEAFDEAIKARIERATQKATAEAAKKFEGYISPEDLAAKTEGLNKEIETLKGQLGEKDKSIAELTTANKSHELNSARMKSAVAHGIPLDLADRLTGSTTEEIEADAEKLAQFVKSSSAPPMMTTETVQHGPVAPQDLLDKALLSALDGVSS